MATTVNISTPTAPAKLVGSCAKLRTTLRARPAGLAALSGLSSMPGATLLMDPARLLLSPKANSRVDERIQDVDDEIDYYKERGDDEDATHNQRVVAGADRVSHQAAEPWQ